MSLTKVYDEVVAELKKIAGMDHAAENRHENLALARKIAKRIAKRNGDVTADDVGQVLLAKYGIETLGPAAGAIFRGKEWKFSGRWVPSTKVTNHGRMIRVWIYIGA